MVYFKQIITLMESCLIRTHAPSSYIYKSLKFPLINNCFPVLQKRHLGAESFVKCNMNKQTSKALKVTTVMMVQERLRQ